MKAEAGRGAQIYQTNILSVSLTGWPKYNSGKPFDAIKRKQFLSLSDSSIGTGAVFKVRTEAGCKAPSRPPSIRKGSECLGQGQT